MVQFTIRRLILSVPVVFAIMLITFTLGFYGPGDPLSIVYGIGQVPDPVIVARLKKQYGLDRPYHVQLLSYINRVFHGDLGNSLGSQTRGRPVISRIKYGLPISAQLGGAATLLLVVVGIPLGILAAIKQNKWIDYWIVSFAISVRSFPVFVLGPMVMILFVLKLGWMDVPAGWNGLFSAKSILPVVLMATGPLVVVVRQTRSGILEVAGQEYLRTARAKGLRERRVISRHMLQNAFTPILTSMGLIVTGLLTGIFLVELIFGIPGFAGQSIRAIQQRDYPMIMATVLFSSGLVIASNLAVDILYGVVDPRVRME